MGVRSTPLTKKSAIVSGAQLEAMRPWYERLIGLALLVVSFLGTMVVMNGGWARSLPWLDTFKPGWGLAAGFGIQLLATYTEVTYRKNRVSLPYATALLVDIGFTAAGFYPLFAVALLALLARLAVPMPVVISWVIIVLAAVALAITPEAILIDD
jgi:hypothetical protein